jgi:hypothetical protein
VVEFRWRTASAENLIGGFGTNPAPVLGDGGSRKQGTDLGPTDRVHDVTKGGWRARGSFPIFAFLMVVAMG